VRSCIIWTINDWPGGSDSRLVMMEQNEPLIFISYASPDRARVDPIVDELERSDLNIWMDHRRIMAGQKWDMEIRRALGKAAIVVVFLSSLSIDRRGYVQREIKIALQQAEEKLSEDIYIIPVLLDDLDEFPEAVRHLHMIKAWESGAVGGVKRSIRAQLAELGQHIQEKQADSRIKWVEKTFKETWDGLPGYEVDYNLLQLSSVELLGVPDITSIIHGEICKITAGCRGVKFSQDASIYSFGQSKFNRTNVFSAHCRDPIIVNHVICFPYLMHSYNAGAVHGMEWLRSFNFTLDPVTEISSIESIFTDKDGAFLAVQKSAREKLTADLIGADPSSADLYGEWIVSGTEDWSSFHNFTFSNDGIEFHFPPYQVASYADGIRIVLISKWDIYMYMPSYLLDALGWAHLRWQERPVG